MALDKKFNVDEYEALIPVYDDIGRCGNDWSVRQSLDEATASIGELCKEIRRLQGGVGI